MRKEATKWRQRSVQLSRRIHGVPAPLAARCAERAYKPGAVHALQDDSGDPDAAMIPHTAAPPLEPVPLED